MGPPSAWCSTATERASFSSRLRGGCDELHEARDDGRLGRRSLWVKLRWRTPARRYALIRAAHLSTICDAVSTPRFRSSSMNARPSLLNPNAGVMPNGSKRIKSIIGCRASAGSGFQPSVTISWPSVVAHGLSLSPKRIVISFSGAASGGLMILSANFSASATQTYTSLCLSRLLLVWTTATGSRLALRLRCYGWKFSVIFRYLVATPFSILSRGDFLSLPKVT